MSRLFLSLKQLRLYRIVQEVRELRFWFKSTVAEERRNDLTEDFFKDLLNPTDFPTGLITDHFTL